MKPACLAGALVFAFPCLAIAQVANLQIKIMEGDAVMHASGARRVQPLAVLITDGAGHAVPGAAVSFRMPDEGPSGLFANGLRTELAVSDSNGRASVRNLRLNTAPGAFQIRITAAREQARAGALSRQFIEATPERAKAKSGKKWILIGLALAGVAGELGAGVVCRRKPAPSTATVMAAPAPPALTIGPPTVIVGKP